MARLKVSELRFLEEYACNGFKLSVALARAGLYTPSPKATLKQLMKNKSFKAAFDERMQQSKMEETIKKEVVIGELANMAFADIRDYYDDKGNLKPLKDLAPHAAKAIVGVKTTKVKNRHGDETVIIDSYEIADKLGALQLLGRTVDLQLFKDTKDVNITAELTDRPTSELVSRLLTLFQESGGGTVIEGHSQEVKNGETIHLLPGNGSVPA